MRRILSGLALSILGCAEPHRTLPACADPADAATSADPTLLAVGDLALCHDPSAATLAAFFDRNEGTIGVLGDIVYESGSLDELLDCYEPAMGRHRGRTRPSVGNHEYRTPHAGAYFSYFCGLGGEPFKGWYSYELGAWHVVVLNSNCNEVGCDGASEQVRWLRADLAAHPSRCTVAYWHHPRFNSGAHGAEPRVQPFWDALDAAGAELVLNGHEHAYERFVPQTSAGVRDDARGLRQLIVGTGGRSPSALRDLQQNSAVRLEASIAILELKLHDGSYDFRLVGADGKALDSGRGDCH